MVFQLKFSEADIFAINFRMDHASSNYHYHLFVNFWLIKKFFRFSCYSFKIGKCPVIKNSFFWNYRRLVCLSWLAKSTSAFFKTQTYFFCSFGPILYHLSAGFCSPNYVFIFRELACGWGKSLHYHQVITFDTCTIVLARTTYGEIITKPG